MKVLNSCPFLLAFYVHYMLTEHFITQNYEVFKWHFEFLLDFAKPFKSSRYIKVFRGTNTWHIARREVVVVTCKDRSGYRLFSCMILCINLCESAMFCNGDVMFGRYPNFELQDLQRLSNLGFAQWARTVDICANMNVKKLPVRLYRENFFIFVILCDAYLVHLSWEVVCGRILFFCDIVLFRYVLLETSLSAWLEHDFLLARITTANC